MQFRSRPIQVHRPARCTPRWLGPLIALGLLDLPLFILAQGEANNWYFGANAGITFNNGAPEALTGSAMNTTEGCATISDPQGEILFYTNGSTVWNADHEPMPNGEIYDVWSNWSSTMAACIVPKPCSTSEYYIFSVPHETALDLGMRYSLVDMDLEGGSGDVVSSEEFLFQPSTEKVCAIRHANGVDVWVLGHEYNSNVFHAYLVTDQGVSSTSVASATGTTHQNVPLMGMDNNALGYMKGSPDGSKLALAIRTSGTYELFAFDNATGVVSQPVTINSGSFSGTDFLRSAYSLEFSPSGNFLYVWRRAEEQGLIYQLPLDQGWSAAVITSNMQMIATLVPALAPEAGLQLGPDGKIYVCQFEINSLGVIHDPDQPGPSCNYMSAQVDLAGNESNIGLPNFINDYFLPLPFTFLGQCQGSPTSFEPAVAYAGASITWLFGDGTSTTAIPAMHTYTAPGTYEVQMIVSEAGSTDTLSRIVVIHPSVSGPFLGPDTTFCEGQPWVLQVSGECAVYEWHDGSSDPAFTVIGPGVHWVTIDGSCGVVSDTLIVMPGAGAQIDLGVDTTICPGSSIVLDAGDLPEGEWLWSTGSVNNSIVIDAPGTYWVHLSIGDCSSNDTINVALHETAVLDLDSPLYLCAGMILVLDAGDGHETYEWSNGSTEQVISVSDPGEYAVIVFDGSCTASDTTQVLQAPAAPKLDDVFGCPGSETTLEVPVPVTQVVWSNGQDTTNILVTETGTYWYSAIDQHGCTIQDTVEVMMIPLEEAFAGIPNVYTPNNDGMNDDFIVDGLDIQDFHMEIYDRWGQKVFETSDPGIGWNGERANSIHETHDGTYFYIIKFKDACADGSLTTNTGHITLLR